MSQSKDLTEAGLTVTDVFINNNNKIIRTRYIDFEITPPTATGFILYAIQDTEKTLTFADFIHDFSGEGQPNQIKFNTLPTSGIIKVDGNVINSGDVFTYTPDVVVTYKGNVGGYGRPYGSFTFSISDENGIFTQPLYVDIYVNGKPQVVEKALSGRITSGAVIGISTANFLSLFIDPDNDLPKKIRFAVLPQHGYFKTSTEIINEGDEFLVDEFNSLGVQYYAPEGIPEYTVDGVGITMTDDYEPMPAESEVTILAMYLFP